MRKLPFVAPGSDSLTGTAILRGRDGAIWFGTGVGVFRLRPDGAIDHYDASDGVGNSAVSEVSCMAEDAAGTLWVGTAGGGLSRFDGSGWTTITTDQGLTSVLISSKGSMTFPVGLYSVAGTYGDVRWGETMAAAVVGTIPVFVLFLLFQRWLVSGLTSGAVKG